MKIIAHRGNMDGPNPVQENHPDYITKALQLNFDVEVDVWFLDGKFYLGHDAPQYEIEKSFLRNDRFWCHAKDIFSLEAMLENNMICFWHQNDDVTLTSSGHIWTYP